MERDWTGGPHPVVSFLLWLFVQIFNEFISTIEMKNKTYQKIVDKTIQKNHIYSSNIQLQATIRLR